VLRETDRGVVRAYYRVKVCGPDSVRDPASHLRETVHTTTDVLLGLMRATVAGGGDTSRREARLVDAMSAAAQWYAAFVEAIESVVAEQTS